VSAIADQAETCANLQQKQAAIYNFLTLQHLQNINNESPMASQERSVVECYVPPSLLPRNPRFPHALGGSRTTEGDRDVEVYNLRAVGVAGE
jgi:hypothetical protein